MPLQDVGQFGATGNLPTDPGPIDPPILTGDYPGNYYPSTPNAQDIWTRMDPNMGYIDPSLTVYPANPADAYPSPGDGAPAPPRQSVISRIMHNIPAVRLATALGRLIPQQPWQNNAASRTGPMQGPPAVPPGGALFGFNPAQGGGTPHFDFTRGSYTTTPASNPLYSTGGPWQPVANAPVDIRWDENSGTGNFTAGQTTKYWEAGGGYKGNPNRAVAPDSGRNTFSPQSGFTGSINPESGLLERHAAGNTGAAPFRVQQGGPTLRAGNAASTEAYNAWLMNQPGYHWANQPNAANAAGELQPFGWMGAGTPSGPPQLPDWLFGT